MHYSHIRSGWLRFHAGNSSRNPLPRPEFDLELISAARAAVSVPLIASGGAGRVEHFAPAVRAGADAVLAASVFHYGTLHIDEVKAALAAEGFEVR